MTTNSTADRLHYLDWLRVLTVMLLVPFHGALPFVAGYYWWVTSVQKNVATQALVNVLDQYHMPLLFLIAGGAVWFSLSRRSGGEFMLERLKRLVVPAVFAALAFVAANHFLSQQHYFYADPVNQNLLRMNLLDPFGSYLQHYPDILTNKLIPFTSGWNPGLLWFLWYLIFYTLVFFPLFLLVRRKGGRFTSWLAWFFEKPGAVFLLAIPIALVRIYPPQPEAMMSIWTFQTFQVFYFVLFFVFGFFLISEPRIRRGLEKTGPIAIVGGIITMTLFMLIVFPPGNEVLGPAFWERFGYGPGTTGNAIFLTLQAFNGWFWIIGLIYLAKRFLNFSNRFLRYANDAVLPFYILHETSLVTVGYFVMQTDMAVGPKYAILVSGAFGMTVVLYEIIRRTNITRFAMGMRLKRRPVPADKGPG